jgi:hypothetical protein
MPHGIHASLALTRPSGVSCIECPLHADTMFALVPITSFRVNASVEDSMMSSACQALHAFSLCGWLDGTRPNRMTESKTFRSWVHNWLMTYRMLASYWRCISLVV